jgi:hypothetical protein
MLDSESALYLKDRLVRPGERYILLALSPAAVYPTWATALRVMTENVVAYELRIPQNLCEKDRDDLSRLGLSVRGNVFIRPVGLVPASWDGDGVAEWLVGEDPLIAIRSTMPVASCNCVLDGEVLNIQWPPNRDEVFIALSGLESGEYELHVSLQGSDSHDEILNGTLTIRMTLPQIRSDGGTFREGLLLYADPVSPSLEELWEDRASLQIIGPAGIEVQIRIVGTNRDGTTILTHTFQASLPIHGIAWRQIVNRELRGQRHVVNAYQDLESCTITACHPGLGRVSVDLERSFEPLRWVHESARDDISVRLINNVELPVIYEVSEFQSPAQRNALTVAPGSAIHRAAGGLITARAGGCEAHCNGGALC